MDNTLRHTPRLDFSHRVLIESSDLLARLRQLTMTSVEQGSDLAALERVIDCAKQAHNTFKLIECFGAELLCGELLSLLEAIHTDSVSEGFDTAPVLVLASEKLSEYVDYLKGGGIDLPLALLPLVNNIRACTGSSLLSESLIVAPHFSVPTSTPVRWNSDVTDELAHMTKLRLPLMKSLLQWYADPSQANGAELATQFKTIESACPKNDLLKIFEAATVLTLSLSDGGLMPNAAVKMLLGQLERFVHELEQQASDTICFPDGLFRNLLYYLALSESTDAAVVEFKRQYRLNELLPPKNKLEVARAALGGPGASLSEAICTSVAQELSEVKSALEACTSLDGGSLNPIRNRLQQVSYTLLLLELHEARRLNLRAIHRIGLAEKTGDLRLLQAVASDVLQVFAVLDEHQHGRRSSTIFADDFSAELVGSAKLSRYQFKRIVDKCLSEAVVSVQSVQSHFLLVKEDHSRMHQLQIAAEELLAIANALQILPLPEVRPLLDGGADYLRHVVESTVFPAEPAEQSFAQLLVCLEFYLDPTLQQQAAAAQLLLQADMALDELQESVPDFFADDATLLIDPAQGADNIHDATLLDSFIGEALESLSAINNSLASWKRTDRAAHLIDLQQHYHVLGAKADKAGATALRLLAVANEKLLAAVISDEVADVNGAVMMRAEEARVLADQLDESIGVIPQLINLLPAQGESLPHFDELLARLEQSAASDNPDLNDAESTQAISPSDLDESIADITDELIIAASEDTGMEDIDWLEETVVTPPPAMAASGVDMHVVEPEPDAAESNSSVSAWDADETADLSLEATRFLAGEIAGDITEDTALSQTMDNTLLKVFFSECKLHIGLLKEEIGDAFFASRLHLPTPVMQRSLHTLHGSAQTAGVPGVVELAAPLELFAQKRMTSGNGMNRDETVVASDAVLAIELIVDALTNGEQPPDVTAVQAQLDVLVLAEESEDSDDAATNDLQGLFVEEAGELLQAIHENVAEIRGTENQLEPIAEITRSLHTLKGSARVARFNAIADVTHSLEGALQRWKGELPLSSTHLDSLQQAVDAITINLDQARSGGELGQFDWLIAELEDDQSGYDETIASVPTASVPAEALDATLLSATQSMNSDDDTMVISSPFTNRQPLPEMGAANLAVSSPPALSESDQIRLDSSSVGRLSDLATEVSVHHARVSEHFHALRHTLVDLDKTTDRLRYKLRELQDESTPGVFSNDNENFTVSSTGAEQDATTRFDPLELEQYTQSRENARQLSEILADFDSIRSTLQSQLAHTEDDVSATARLDADIQQSLMRSRLVRFGQHTERLGSVVRQTASALDKQVDWSLNGGELEIDRGVQKALGGALEHLIRNAITHGIESSEVRKAAGKTSVGQVTLGIEFSGSDLMVTVSDDGAGVDLEAIKSQLSSTDADTSLTDEALLNKLFEAGFSTTEVADDYAGRGVGLDVVAKTLAELNGDVDIATATGQGTTVTLRIPQRIVINQVVLVDVGGAIYGIPVNCVHTVQAVESDAVEFDGEDYASCDLADLLGVDDVQTVRSTQAVLVEIAGQKLALRVNDVPGYRELIARPLGSQLSSLRCFSGGGILSSGQCVLMLDVAALLATPMRSKPLQRATTVHEPEVLVVDDSITMRTYAGKILLKHGYRVRYARDGIEALECLSRNTPDLVLLDVEMPRMDGFDFLSTLRREARYEALPVIMITSRAAAQHRQRASDLNAQGYMVKPYREPELLRYVTRHIGASASIAD